MKLKMSLLVLLMCLGLVFAAEEAVQAPADEAAEPMDMEIKLPPNDSAAYWNIRSEAVSELIPFLTSKRAEMTQKMKFLADYLLKIDKASEFASSDIQAPEDPKYYAEVLNLTKRFDEENIPIPEKRPTWDEIVEIAMKHVMFEGYAPTVIEGGEEMEMYKDLCKNKERYGQKVREDLHDILRKGVRMWLYLGTIDEQGNAKAQAADMVLEQKAQVAQEKEQLTAMKRDAALERQQERIDQKHEDAMDRSSFRSSRRSRAYTSRENRQRYRQTRLDERYANSRRYYW